MLNKLNRIRFLWVILALISLAAAIIGIIRPQIYNGLVAPKYLAGTISQDLIALIAAVLLLVIAIVVKEKSVILQLIGLGILGFLFYAYGIYVIEQIYNLLYLVYMAIFSLSLYSIIYSLVNLKKDVLNAARIPKGIRTVSIGFSFLIPLVFIPLWISMLISLITTGQHIENTYGVFIMDLCFIMPAFIILAVMHIKKRGLGVLLTPSLFVLGFALLFPVGMAEPVKMIYTLDTAFDIGSFLMYCIISLVFLTLSIIYMKSLRSTFKSEL